MKPLKLILLNAIISLSSYAQTTCVTHLCEAQKKQFQQTAQKRTNLDLSLFENVVGVPLTIHIIRDANKENGLEPDSLTVAINDLNNQFAPVNMNFVKQSTKYIDNNTFYNEIKIDTIIGTNEYLMAEDRIDGTINVFFVPNAIDYEGNEICGWACYPAYLTGYSKNWIVIDNDCATNSSTFAHEMGHYFSLYHTHEHGNELVNKSNCGNPGIGDELCDTPASPNLRLQGLMDENCNYVGSAVDSQNEYFIPDVSNIMSYALADCRDTFSPSQITRMQQSYIYDRRSFTTDCLYDSEVYDGRERDSLALLDLYFDTKGDSWVNSWKLNLPMENWIQNDSIIIYENRVTAINLFGNNLDGSISCSLVNLQNLSDLQLSNNNLTGNIPPEVGQLQNLTQLLIGSNKLEGNIPSELSQLQNLNTLNLSNNRLEGNIPSELSQIISLENLELFSNRLTGNIPSELSQLQNLDRLHLSHNDLTGPIPVELSQLSNLTYLNFVGNELGGTVPIELSQLQRLIYLYLSDNKLMGTIPSELGQLTSLAHLGLYRNQLSGIIPSELFELNRLISLRLDNNQLEGGIPSTLGQLQNLQVFRLSNNLLSGYYSEILKEECSNWSNRYISDGNNFVCSWEDFCNLGMEECASLAEPVSSESFRADIYLYQIGSDTTKYQIDLLDTVIVHGFSGEVSIPKTLLADTVYVDLRGSNFDRQSVSSSFDKAQSRLNFSVAKSTELNDTIVGPILRVVVIAVVGLPGDPGNANANMQSLWVSAGSITDVEGNEVFADIDPGDAPVNQNDEGLDLSNGINESNLYCVDHLLVNHTTAFRYYQASSLESNAIVPDTANVLFHFKEEINLTPGFTVEKGAKFQANPVEDCQ